MARPPLGAELIHFRPPPRGALTAHRRSSACTTVRRCSVSPSEGANRVVVRGFPPKMTHEKLVRVFSECGLIATLVLYTPEDHTQMGYALVQYFSQSEFLQCIHMNDGRNIDGRQLHVYPLPADGKRDQALPEGVTLPASKAIDMMNHFVGYARWSHEVLSVRPLGAVSPGQSEVQMSARVRVTCAGDVTIEQEGIGQGEGDSRDIVGQAMKKAVTNAVKAALSGLVILRWPCGKAVVRLLPDGSSSQAPRDSHDDIISQLCGHST
ncbi:hypothetical protein AB1Y20_013063 [Prymnesium parvum]|uniref:RRM domain-containing protein n=1 Tax=Prymnesium parvum TaxID=97485 RepID=A0AB34IM29_PRYPA